MVGKLIFKLPEENEEFQLAQQAGAYLATFEELSSFLKSKLKYGELNEQQYAIYDEIRSKLWELKEQYGITS